MLRLEDREWKAFTLDEIDCRVVNSKAYHASTLKIGEGSLPYITRMQKNNGLLDVVIDTGQRRNPGNTISFGAENAEFYYQPYSYITGNKMYYIVAPLNMYQMLFLRQSLSNATKGQFSYGYGLIPERLLRKKLMLPVTINGEPDYQFMEDYVREMIGNKLQRWNGYVNYKEI